MEKELNYLSEKIEAIEHDINMVDFGIPLGVGSADDLIKLNNEKDMLENILNHITLTLLGSD